MTEVIAFLSSPSMGRRETTENEISQDSPAFFETFLQEGVAGEDGSTPTLDQAAADTIAPGDKGSFSTAGIINPEIPIQSEDIPPGVKAKLPSAGPVGSAPLDVAPGIRPGVSPVSSEDVPSVVDAIDRPDDPSVAAPQAATSATTSAAISAEGVGRVPENIPSEPLIETTRAQEDPVSKVMPASSGPAEPETPVSDEAPSRLGSETVKLTAAPDEQVRPVPDEQVLAAPEGPAARAGGETEAVRMAPEGQVLVAPEGPAARAGGETEAVRMAPEGPAAISAENTEQVAPALKETDPNVTGEAESSAQSETDEAPPVTKGIEPRAAVERATQTPLISGAAAPDPAPDTQTPKGSDIPPDAKLETPLPLRGETQMSDQLPQYTPAPETKIPTAPPLQNTVGVIAAAPTETSGQSDQPTLPPAIAENQNVRLTSAPIPAPPPQLPPGQTQPNPAQQIMVAIERLQIGERISLRLDPPDLGKVTIRMEIVAGTITAIIAADRPDTVELFTRHRQELGQLLGDAGFDEAETRIELQEQGGNRDGQNQAARNAEPMEETALTLAGEHEDLQSFSRPVEAAYSDGRLDIRV